MFEKWFGARITGPEAGTLGAAIARVRYGPSAIGVITIRASSYVQPGSWLRDHSWIGVKRSAGRSSLYR